MFHWMHEILVPHARLVAGRAQIGGRDGRESEDGAINIELIEVFRGAGVLQLGVRTKWKQMDGRHGAWIPRAASVQVKFFSANSFKATSAR
jgi:hypothetical protein